MANCLLLRRPNVPPNTCSPRIISTVHPFTFSKKKCVIKNNILIFITMVLDYLNNRSWFEQYIFCLFHFLNLPPQVWFWGSQNLQESVVGGLRIPQGATDNFLMPSHENKVGAMVEVGRQLPDIEETFTWCFYTFPGEGPLSQVTGKCQGRPSLESEWARVLKKAPSPRKPTFAHIKRTCV